MELAYRQAGDYLIPNLIPPESPKVGKYGMLRHEYLLSRKRGIFDGMMAAGTLNAHLEEIDRLANETVEGLISKMAKEQKVTEKLKAEDPMKWVGLMNNIKESAEETVLNDLIYS